MKKIIKKNLLLIILLIINQNNNSNDKNYQNKKAELMYEANQFSISLEKERQEGFTKFLTEDKYNLLKKKKEEIIEIEKKIEELDNNNYNNNKELMDEYNKFLNSQAQEKEKKKFTESLKIYKSNLLKSNIIKIIEIERKIKEIEKINNNNNNNNNNNKEEDESNLFDDNDKEKKILNKEKNNILRESEYIINNYKNKKDENFESILVLKGLGNDRSKVQKLKIIEEKIKQLNLENGYKIYKLNEKKDNILHELEYIINNYENKEDKNKDCELNLILNSLRNDRSKVQKLKSIEKELEEKKELEKKEKLMKIFYKNSIFGFPYKK